jgi:hypothetical protein
MNSPLTPKKSSILLKVFIASILLIGALLVGGQFEQGRASMKSIVEGASKP